MKRQLVRFPIVFFAVLSVVASLAQSQERPAKPAVPNGAASQPGGVSQEARGGAEAEIRRLLNSQVEAWNHGDLEGFMKGYWRSPELTFYSGGNVAQGWDGALQRYQRSYQGSGKEMGALEFQGLEIDVLSPEAAVVMGKWQLTKSDGKKPHGLFTLILKKFQPGWQIVHDHTSSAEES
jgi:beta-aspartyl-peptidase (threonine type)